MHNEVNVVGGPEHVLCRHLCMEGLQDGNVIYVIIAKTFYGLAAESGVYMATKPVFRKPSLSSS